MKPTKRKRPPDEDVIPADEANPKRQRPDVTARRTINAGTTVSVVKTMLNSFCKKKAKALPWESVLKDMNKSVLEAYVLANIHAVRLCQTNLSLEPMKQTLFYRCLSAVTSDLRESPACKQMKQFIALYNEWRGTGVNRANNKYISSGWQQNASMHMATNSTNAVNLNIYRRFHKHLKQKYDFHGHQAYATLKCIPDPKYNGNDSVVLEWRARIPRREDDGKLDSQPHLFLPLTPQISGRGIEPEWNAVVDEWWREIFNIYNFETANCKFASEIATDVKAVSITMRKPKQKIVNRKFKAEDYDVIWGLNSGRRDFFVATNQKGEKVSCSTREFYEDAKYKKRSQTFKV